MSSSCLLLPTRGFRREVHVSQETIALSERRRPAFKLPAGACDAHCHVFGPGATFPYAPNRRYTPEDAPKDRFSPKPKLQPRLSGNCIIWYQSIIW